MNFEGSDMLPYLQAHKLDCYSSRDADRDLRQWILLQQSFIFLLVLLALQVLHRGDMQQPR